MARKALDKSPFRKAPVSNQSLIEDLIVNHNYVGPDSNAEILKILLRQQINLDAIISDKDRAETAKKFSWYEPSSSERVLYIEEQIRTSTSNGSAWEDLLLNGVLINSEDYHKLRNQRLQEQIRQTRKKIEDTWAEAERREALVAGSGNAEPISWEEADDEVLQRIPSWNSELDKWYGEAERDGVISNGMVRGFSYVLGTEKGLGKTRWMVKKLGMMCGPRRQREDGVIYGGLTGLYVQAEQSPSMFRSLFLNGMWEPNQVNVNLANITMLDKLTDVIERDRPDIIVIDSKDMIHEFNGPDQRVREGVVRLNETLDKFGAVAFIISHVSKKGDIKGSTMLGHMAHAEILGKLDTTNTGHFSLWFTKNRAGRTGYPMRFVHNNRGVELNTGGVIVSDGKPNLTQIQVHGITGDLQNQMLEAIQRAQGV